MLSPTLTAASQAQSDRGRAGTKLSRGDGAAESVRPESGSSMHAIRHIAIVDANPARAAILADGLRHAGCDRLIHIDTIHDLLSRVEAINPDVILIDLERPTRDTLDAIFELTRAVKRPIAVFVEDSDTKTVQDSIDAGVSAYIVGEIKQERVRHVLDVCVSRFDHVSRLRLELERAKTALEERKIIDRAKGMLMAAKNLTEDQAYALMRTTAMNENKKLANIAQSIVTACDLLKQH
jgi:response regulator NasT